jgi:hypothetical protein
LNLKRLQFADRLCLQIQPVELDRALQYQNLWLHPPSYRHLGQEVLGPSWRWGHAFEVVDIPANYPGEIVESFDSIWRFNECTANIASMLHADPIHDLSEGNDSLAFAWQLSRM